MRVDNQIKLAISLFFSGFFSIFSGSLWAELSHREEVILQRIQPVGELVQGTADGSPKPAPVQAAANVSVGEMRYKAHCVACHATGVAGAPKFGDKEEWAKRLAVGGEDLLVQHALAGYKAMPAKGTCMDCSDEDIKKTITYMLENAK